jgi:hypothetical protein
MAPRPTASEKPSTPARKVPPKVVPQVIASSDAADQAVEENVTRLSLPIVGELSLPPLDHVAWYAGVGILTAVEMLEWPVAVVLTVGKILADSRTHRTLRSFGDALEDAG